MRKIWPSQDNCTQLKDKFASCEFGTPTCEIKAQLAKVILQLANPPGQQLHPDVSHPESPATTSTRMTSGNLLCHTFHPMSYIRNLGAGWERREFQLPRSDIFGSSNRAYPESFAAILQCRGFLLKLPIFATNIVRYFALDI